MSNTVNNHTRAGKGGKNIFCPVCEWSMRVYNFAWSALVCHGCGQDIQKGEFLLSKSAKSTMEEEERLSICCGADEDENIENMCSACHESTTFTGEEETPSPEPETPTLYVGFSFKEAVENKIKQFSEKTERQLLAIDRELEELKYDPNSMTLKHYYATEKSLLQKSNYLRGKLSGLTLADLIVDLLENEEVNVA